MLGRYDPRDNHGRCRSDSYERHQGSRAGATETTSARIVDGMYSVGKSIFRKAQTASWCAVGNDRTN
jgi:hypothetical protein